jgi:zinc transport system permease protein
MNFLNALLLNPLLQMALLAAAASSIAGAIAGSYVVTKRIVFLAGSISHAVLGGVGAAIWLRAITGWQWLSPFGGAVAVALVAACTVGWIHLKYKQREDSTLALIWSVGMALGILCVSLTPGANLESFLLGSLLWVEPSDVVWLLLLDAIVVVCAVVFHRRFVALCFDEDQARLQGVAVKRLYMLLLVLISLTVVLLSQAVGVILVLTMLTLPAALANLYCRRMSTLMVTAVILNLLFCLGGTVASFYLNWPSGATIALLAGAAYLLALAFRRKRPAFLGKARLPRPAAPPSQSLESLESARPAAP